MSWLAAVLSSLDRRVVSSLALVALASLLGVEGFAWLGGYVLLQLAFLAASLLGSAGIVVVAPLSLAALSAPIIAALLWRRNPRASASLAGALLLLSAGWPLYAALMLGDAVLATASLAQAALALAAGLAASGLRYQALLSALLLLWLSSPLSALTLRLYSGPEGEVPLALAALLQALPASLAAAMLMWKEGCRPGALAGAAASLALLLLTPLAVAVGLGEEPLLLAAEAAPSVAALVLVALWGRHSRG